MKFFKNTKFKILGLMALFVCSAYIYHTDRVTISADEETTISIRILTTGDLHGQATSYNYETGERYEAVGLSKLTTLINNSRNKYGKSNTILLDAGDFLYDYASNYIYENHPDVIQPVMQIMDALEYDCITLGNHEFDYPWEYLVEQLKSSNLYDKTVVSNVFYEDSMEAVFAPSIIIEKEAVASDGTVYPVKIAIIGATRHGFSTRRYYYGFLTSDKIYDSVIAEAKRIKEDGSADLVVALIHGGTGIKSGANTDTHPGARLAKSKYLDAVVTSHSHEEFPSPDNSYSAYKIADEKTGLVYGVPLVATGAHAQALGIIDITLRVNSDGSYTTMAASASLSHVTADLGETKLCNRIFNQYMLEMSDNRDKTQYPVAEGMVYTNLDCFIQDNALYQLYNNAKLEYAYTHVAENYPEYNNLPIVAATANFMDNTADYIAVTDYFDEETVAKIIAETSIMRDSGYIHIYKITGAKLREWLEYNASFYATAKTTTQNILPSLYAKKPGEYLLVREPLLNDYDSFFIFDGINYEIDISQKPRYNSYGNLLASSRHRITSLTYNGIEIADDQEFLIVMDSLDERFKFMPTDDESIFTTLPWYNGKQIFIDYLKELSYLGPINIQADNNWSLKLPSDKYPFVVGMPMYVREYIESADWFVSYAANNYDYDRYPIFYRGLFPSKEKCRNRLNVTLSVNKLATTCLPVTVSVHINKAYNSDIAEICYVKGACPADSPLWNYAVKCDDSFDVSENGVYSVRVTDILGNTFISCVSVTNINPHTADAPRVDTYTNRIADLTGTAIPGSTIIVCDSENNTHTATTSEDGTFKVTLPYQNAFSSLKVYAVYNGKTSQTVDVLVKKTGPDTPYMEELFAGDNIIIGSTEPHTILYLKYGNAIYANPEDFEAIKTSEFFQNTYKLYEAYINISENGYFLIETPFNFKSGKTYGLYAVNLRGKTSKGNFYKVK